MDWLTALCSFIATLLAGGGILGIVTIKENKRAAKLENLKKEQEIKDTQEEQAIQMWKGLAEEYKSQLDAANARCDEKDLKLDEKDNVITSLREELLSTKVHLEKVKALKCSKLACADRIPPLGYTETKSEID